MIKNDLKLFWRGLKKQRLYSLITIGGFALGIATCFLIALYIQHESSYDKHYKNRENIYRVVGKFEENGTRKYVHMQAPLGPTLLEEFPEIEVSGRINPVVDFGAGSNQVRSSTQEQNFFEDGFAYADQGLIDVLEIPIIEGDAELALTEPNSIVISKSKANKLFPNENAVGRLLIVNNNINNPYKVTAVMEDFSSTSHINYSFFMALHPNIFYPGEQYRWDAYNYYTYVRVTPETDIAALEKKLKLIDNKYNAPYSEVRNDHIRSREILRNNKYELQAVENIYLTDEDISEGLLHSDLRFMWMLGAIAIFILIIASVNFINLSTAKLAGRAKEVGLKKTVGAHKGIIVRQFFTESLLYCLISVVLALLLSITLLPFFNELSNASLSIPFTNWWFIPTLLLITIVVGVLSGLYPSLYLSSFKPIKILKGAQSRGVKSSNLRNALVVFQFTTSVVLIVCTLVVHKQMNFILNKDLGFTKEQVLLLHGTSTLDNNSESFKNQVMSIAGVESASYSKYIPVKGMSRNGNGIYKAGRRNLDETIGVQNWVVDYDYLNTLGLNLKQGRNFSPEISSDKRNIIVNEAMVEELGLIDPLGEKIDNGSIYTIIGVVENFNWESIEEQVRPVMMRLGDDIRLMSVKIATQDVKKVIEQITDKWNAQVPNQTMRYSFLDADYARMYTHIERMGKIFSSFSILAIIVACLGLYGLAEYITKERTKEIGVRKVNGAKITEILTSLNSGFAVWVLIAVILACPIAYFAMEKWLEGFAYRAEMTWGLFMISSLTAFLLALITVSWHCWKTANRNPVEALRYE